jgi:hypothetical protein
MLSYCSGANACVIWDTKDLVIQFKDISGSGTSTPDSDPVTMFNKSSDAFKTLQMPDGRVDRVTVSREGDYFAAVIRNSTQSALIVKKINDIGSMPEIFIEPTNCTIEHIRIVKKYLEVGFKSGEVCYLKKWSLTDHKLERDLSLEDSMLGRLFKGENVAAIKHDHHIEDIGEKSPESEQSDISRKSLAIQPKRIAPKVANGTPTKSPSKLKFLRAKPNNLNLVQPIFASTVFCGLVSDATVKMSWSDERGILIVWKPMEFIALKNLSPDAGPDSVTIAWDKNVERNESNDIMVVSPNFKFMIIMKKYLPGHPLYMEYCNTDRQNLFLYSIQKNLWRSLGKELGSDASATTMIK